MTVDGPIDRTIVARTAGAARRLPTVLGMRLQQRIGGGGEGEVWAAAAPDGSTLAVKLIRPQIVAEPAVFTLRAQALARIDDPALVRVLNARVLTSGEWAGWGAMVMELVDGTPLGDARLGAAAFAELEPLALALDRLHEGAWSEGEPLVHRDVKPANLIRAGDGRVVLVDPSTLRTVGQDMTYVGTPVFAAPEIATGRSGPPADVYSFAATLVALHSGARGDDLAALLSEPEDLDVPDAVVRALSTDPIARPERCAALVDTTSTVVLRTASPVADSGPGVQSPRTWWRLGLMTVATLPIVVGLVLPLPGVVLAGLAALLGLLVIDPALRDRSALWLPRAVARWLARTLNTDDAERDRVEATVHGALLLPFAPPVAVLLGYGPRMAVLGTGGQISAVALLCAAALTWVAVATADDGRRGQPLARIALSPLWLAGTVAAAIGRVGLALDDAVRASETRRDAAERTHGEEAKDDHTQ